MYRVNPLPTPDSLASGASHRDHGVVVPLPDDRRLGKSPGFAPQRDPGALGHDRVVRGLVVEDIRGFHDAQQANLLTGTAVNPSTFSLYT